MIASTVNFNLVKGLGQIERTREQTGKKQNLKWFRFHAARLPFLGVHHAQKVAWRDRGCAALPGMERTSRFCLVVSVAVLCCIRCSAQQITVADGSLSRPPTLQVDGEGRAFVAAGRQLLRLNSELVPEQNITLSAGAVDISLSSGGERLVVCLEDSSCAVYNASDLSAELSLVQASALRLTDVVNGVALFAAEDSYYAGSHELIDEAAVPAGILRLTQVGGLEGANFVRSMEYDTFPGSFQRDFFAGFMSGTNAYYISFDTNPTSIRGIKVTRVCDVTACPGGSATCGISALYEELFVCGGRSFGAVGDGVCGVSVVEDFAGTTGAGIVISRCRQGFQDSNVVCYVPVAEVDRIMDTRYDSCSMGIGQVNLDWTEFDGNCRQSDVSCSPSPPTSVLKVPTANQGLGV